MKNLFSRFSNANHIFWMVSIMTGLIAVTVGVTLMYILPPYIIDVLNDTGLFTAASITAANSAIAAIQGLGFLVIVIGMIWIVVGIISRGGTGK